MTGPRDNLNAFLKAVQWGTRLTVIPQMNFAQGPSGDGWGLSYSGTIFLLFGPGGTQEQVPPPDPNATPTPTPTPEPTDTVEPTPSPTATP